MSFKTFMQRSPCLSELRGRVSPWVLAEAERACAAAYKAGEREGMKRAEEIAMQAIKLSELMRSNVV